MRQKSLEIGTLVCSKGTSSTASDLVQIDEIYQKLPKSNKKKGVCRPIVESGFITSCPRNEKGKVVTKKAKMPSARGARRSEGILWRTECDRSRWEKKGALLSEEIQSLARRFIDEARGQYF